MTDVIRPKRPEADRLPLHRREVRRGILIFVAAMIMLPGMDAIAKHLASNVSAGQMVLVRFLFQTIFLLPIVALRESFYVGPDLWKHVARGILMVLSSVMFFFALGSMPLTDAIALFFVQPLILTLLAVVLLKEHVGAQRAIAVVVGLAGALAIIRPSFNQFGLVSLLPILAAVTFALFLIITQSLTRRSGIFAMQFYAGVFGSLTIALALGIGTIVDFSPLTVSLPTGYEWSWLVGLSIIAITAHIMIVWALRLVGASIIAPFQYVEIVAAALLGFLFFDDFPPAMVWLGISVIVGSGLYVYHREYRLAGSG